MWVSLEQLAECIDALGGAAAPERLLNVAGLGEDVDTFFNLLREAKTLEVLDVPIGADKTIVRKTDANRLA
jgi:hypothetical protein